VLFFKNKQNYCVLQYTLSFKPFLKPLNLIPVCSLLLQIFKEFLEVLKVLVHERYSFMKIPKF
jgi:hypothetical protein